MNQSEHSVQTLQEEIGALRDALSSGQLELMPKMSADHDLHLNQYCKSANIDAEREALTALSRMQHELIAMMRERQRQILELMRVQHSSSRAAVAYSRGGWL